MNKVFIDCGGHCGCSVRKFRKEIDIKHEYECISFECNPKLFKYYDDVDTKLIKKAVWISNDNKKLYISTGNRLSGSTILTDKKSGHLSKDNYSDIECIDFPTWIQTRFIKNDYIVLKIDIEGAEYAVLEQMINDGSLKNIQKLFIEFHSKKMKDLTYAKRETNILEYLKEHHIKPITWNALAYCKCRREDLT